MAKKFYAYFIEQSNKTGIVTTWDECKEIIAGKKTRYKSFSSQSDAQEWLDSGALYENKKLKKELLKAELKEGIYFDAGTGRGIGVEVRVTDKSGLSLLPDILNSAEITEHGNYLAPEFSTNNYGELLGIQFALELAFKKNILCIFGDSRLIIDYWSKGIANFSSLKKETVELINKVSQQRKKFEVLGGKIEHVSGDINPADLGFHK
jgi:ribonuclease HI